MSDCSGSMSRRRSGSVTTGEYGTRGIDSACRRARSVLEEGCAEGRSIERVTDTIRDLGLSGGDPARVVACKPQSDTLPAALRILSETGSMTAAKAVTLMGCTTAGPLCVSDEQGERVFRVFIQEPMERGADMTRLLPMYGWDFYDIPGYADLSRNVILRSHGSTVSEETVALRDTYAVLFGCDDPVVTLERIGFEKAALMCALRYHSNCTYYWSWAGSDTVMRMLADSGDAFDSRMDAILDLLDGGDGHGDIRDVVVPVGRTVASIAEGLPASFIMEDLRRGPSRLAYIRRAAEDDRRISDLIMGGVRSSHPVGELLGLGSGLASSFRFFYEAMGLQEDPGLKDFYGWESVRRLTGESIRHGSRMLDLLEAVPEDVWTLMYHDCHIKYATGFVLDNPNDPTARIAHPDQDPEWAWQVLSAGTDATYRWMVWTHVQNWLSGNPYRYSATIPRIGRRYVLKGRLPSPGSAPATGSPDPATMIAGLLANVPVSWDAFMQAMADSGADDADSVLTGMMEDGMDEQDDWQYANPESMLDPPANMSDDPSDDRIFGSVWD